MRNCTRSVRSFQFPQESGSTTRLSSFLSLAMFSTVEAGLITEDVSIIDQTRKGVGAPLFGLDRYVYVLYPARGANINGAIPFFNDQQIVK